MSTTKFDVVIVGAGPAGSLAAFALAGAGVRTLLLDSQEFPRDKPCGGGIQQRGLKHIPFSCDSVFRSRLDQVCFCRDLAPRFLRKSESTLVFGVLRREFDHVLLNRAAEAGAHVWGGCKFRGVSGLQERKLQISTSRGDIEADYLIGADGANSAVARFVNSRDSYFWQVALYAEVPDELTAGGRPSTMTIDWGTIPAGYGWVFPKAGMLNVGVGGPVAVGKSLRSYLDKFLASRPELTARIGKPQIKGHQLPTLTRSTRLESGRVLLVGDAAGLVEPLTGEGISNACHSAGLAARVLLDRMNGIANGGAYERLVRHEIGAELAISRQLLSLAVAFPRTLFRLLERDEVVWKTFCEVLTGETGLASLAHNLVRNYGLFKVPMTRVAELQEKIKLLLWQTLGHSRKLDSLPQQVSPY